MLILKYLNNVLLIENFLGIYRNYASQKKIKKFFIIGQLCVQTTLHTVSVIFEIYLLSEGNDNGSIKFIRGCFAFIMYTSLTFVVASIFYSHAFKSYYDSISRLSQCFEEDKKSNRNFKRMYWFSITLFFLLFTFAAYRSSVVSKSFPQTKEYFIIFVPILTSQTILRVTVIFQQVMMYVVEMIMFQLFKCLTSLVSDVQERVERCDISSGEQCDITREQIQGWFELYWELANCCEKVKLCFGRQVFVFVGILTVV